MKVKTIMLVIFLMSSSLILINNYFNENISVSAGKLYVGTDSKYKTIQDAVDNAIVGDTIIVRNETYNENVVINTANLTLKGNGSSATIITGNSGAAFTINADWVNITSFNITTTVDSVCAVKITNANNCSVNNNKIETKGDSGADGIRISSSHHAKIMNNTINVTGSNSNGIKMEMATRSAVVNNTINATNDFGYPLYMSKTDNNTIQDNNITVRGSNGIGLRAEPRFIHNTIRYNTFNATNSSYACMVLFGAIDNTISNNTFINEINNGIGLQLANNLSPSIYSKLNYVANNTINITGTDAQGISLTYAEHNILMNNAINATNDNSYGVRLITYCIENTFEKNNITTYGGGFQSFAVSIEQYSIKNNLIENEIWIKSPNGGRGVYIQNANENNITKNNISILYAPGNPFNYGINIISSSSENNISYNNITTRGDYSRGIVVTSGSSTNTFLENKVTTTGIYALAIYFSGSTSNYNILINNTILTTGVGSTGITSSDITGYIIKRNTISTLDANSRGIGFNPTSDSIFEGNYIKTAGNNAFGMYLGGINLSVMNNTIITKGSTAHGLNFTDSTFINASDLNISVTGSNAAAMMAANTSSIIINSTLVSQNSDDIRLYYDSNVSLTNVSFATTDVSQSYGGKLWVKNYLDVIVYQNESIGPMEDADVLVLDNAISIYNSTGYSGPDQKTNVSGNIRTLVLVDRWYPRSDTAIQNITTIKIKKQGDVLWEEARDVNMAASHTETFISEDITAPAVPSGISVVKEGAAEINISWTANIDDTLNYSIYSNFSGSWEFLQNVTHPNTSFIDNNDFKHNIRYYYKVSAWDEVPIQSALSQNYSIVFSDVTPPQTPTGFTVTKVPNKSAFNITWNANVDDTETYSIYYNHTGSWELLINKSKSETFHVDNFDFIHGKTYYYKILAWDEVPLNSTMTSEFPVKFIDDIAPQAPLGLSVNSVVGGDAINISWTTNTDGDTASYVIYSNRTGGWEVIATVPHPKNYNVSNGYVHGTRYYFKISAMDTIPNESPQSAAESTVHIDYIRPNIPEGLNVTPIAQGDSLKISWFPNNDDTVFYSVYSNRSGDWKILQNVTDSSYFDNSDLVNGTRYYYKVSAWDEVPLESLLSAAQSNVSLDQIKPSPPGGLTAVNATGNTIELKWEPNPEIDIDGYEVYINRSSGRGNGRQYDYIARVGAGTTGYKVTNLTEETTYYFVVSAFDEVPLLSDYSNEANNTTLDKTPPPAPDIAHLPEYTNDSQLIVHGSSEPNATIIIYKSIENVAEGTADTDGKFDISITLIEGVNVISAVAIDTSGNPSSKSPAQNVILDTVQPIASAGSNILESIEIPVEFNGSLSFDKDSGIKNFTWSFFYDNRTTKIYGEVTNFSFESPGEYEVTLRVADYAGNWNEDTLKVKIVEGPVDRTAPEIIDLYPPIDGVDIPADIIIRIRFNEQINIHSLTMNLSAEINESTNSGDEQSNTFEITYDIVPGSLEFEDENMTLKYDPERDLNYNLTYTVAFSIEDLFGNRLQFSWNFKTGLEPIYPPDKTPPEVDNAEFTKENDRMSVDGQIIIPISEPLEESSIDIIIKDSHGDQIAGNWTYDETSLTIVFTPDEPLEYNEEYTVNVQANDTAGNSIPPDNNIFKFTTEDKKEEEGISPFLVWIMLAVIIIVIILIVVVLAMQRRRKEPSEEELEE
jgi:hypothetical protein